MRLKGLKVYNFIKTRWHLVQNVGMTPLKIWFLFKIWENFGKGISGILQFQFQQDLNTY